MDLDFFCEVLRSHSDTPHSVRLLWTSDRPVRLQRDSNPQSQHVHSQRPTPWTAQQLGLGEQAITTLLKPATTRYLYILHYITFFFNFHFNILSLPHKHLILRLTAVAHTLLHGNIDSFWEQRKFTFNEIDRLCAGHVVGNFWPTWSSYNLIR